jgi:voltage-gated potassium channel
VLVAIHLASILTHYLDPDSSKTMIHQLRYWLRHPFRLVRRMLPRRTRRMILIPLLLVATGTIAYPLIEGPKWTYFDGLYMTVITLTTLGYGEIPEPLSRPGRLFTMILALGGIFVLFYIATDIIRGILTGELRELLGKEHMNDALRHLHGHTIVCGFGRMGRIVCDELERLREHFVVINITPPPAEWIYRFGLYLEGDASEDQKLQLVRIEQARALIAVTGSDASNLYITLTARLLNSKLLLIARAEEESAGTKLKKVGANQVISPYLAGGHRAVQAVFQPGVQQYMDLTFGTAKLDLKIEELQVAEGSQLAGKTLRESRLLDEYNTLVVGLVRPNGELLRTPGVDIIIEPGCVLILIGTAQQLTKLYPLTSVEKADKPGVALNRIVESSE